MPCIALFYSSTNRLYHARPQGISDAEPAEFQWRMASAANHNELCLCTSDGLQRILSRSIPVTHLYCIRWPIRCFNLSIVFVRRHLTHCNHVNPSLYVFCRAAFFLAFRSAFACTELSLHGNG